MANTRKTIRESTVALLNGNTVAGSRVFETRIKPITPSETPCINVSIDRETMEPLGTGEPQFVVSISLNVEGYITANTYYDDSLDALMYEVKDLLLTNSTWVNQFDKIKNINTQFAIETDGEQPYGVARLTFDVEFTELFPPVVDDDFTGIDIKVDAIDIFDTNNSPTSTNFYDPTAPDPRTTGPDTRDEIAGSADVDPS